MAHDLMRILPALCGLIVPLVLLYSKWHIENRLVRQVREKALPVPARLSKGAAAYLDRLLTKGVVCKTQLGLYVLDDHAFQRWSRRRNIIMCLVVAWIAALSGATLWLLR